MFAPGPAAGPALAFLQLLLSASNAALTGDRLLGILDPADELIASQGRDALPGVERRGAGNECLTQVLRKLMNHSTGHCCLSGHTPMVFRWLSDDKPHVRFVEQPDVIAPAAGSRIPVPAFDAIGPETGTNPQRCPSGEAGAWRSSPRLGGASRQLRMVLPVANRRWPASVGVECAIS